MPPLAARNSPTSASPAIVSATTISISVKPRLRSALRIGDADPAGQPIDADHHRPVGVGNRDAAARRAAVGIEANVALAGIAPLAGNRQQLDREPRRQALWGR